jgi:pimeloyl-ACP methyl ester carboxylesterase
MKKWLKRLVVVCLIAVLVIAVALYQGDLPKEVVDAKYSSPASQFLTLDSGAKIHFRDEGRSDGQPVVLIHGANASLHTWEPWVGALGNEYRIITLDLPAHGLTGKVPKRDYSTANQVATVEAVVQHLGVDQFVLGGNSMGGGVTWRYALEHPEKVEAMILVDAVGLPQWSLRAAQTSREDGNRGPLVFRLMRQPWFRAIARYIDPYRLTKQGLESAYSDKSKVTDELVDRYYELALREGSREAIVDRFSRVGGAGTLNNVDPTQFTQPTLVMWGRDDALISVDVAEKFAESLPDNSLVIYDDVGHLPMEEIPERSAKDVLEFLGKLQTEATELQAADTE